MPQTYPVPAAGRGSGWQPSQQSLVDRLIASGIYKPPSTMEAERNPDVYGRPGNLFADDHFERSFPGTSVAGEGMPMDDEDPQAAMAMMGLREASGNLAPMLNRYGLGGSGNIDRSGGRTSVTIHGDPVQAEATRVRALRDEARRAGDLNRQMAQTRARLIAGGNDYPRMDPAYAARFERDSVAAADLASPDMPEPSGLPTGVDELAAIRALLTRGRTANVLGRETAVSNARAFMDPTVTQARGIARGEANETQERDIAGRIKAQLAGNPDAAFMPELLKLLGLSVPGGEAETGAGSMDVMSQQELLEFANEQGMRPEEALAYVRQHGITVR